MSKTVIKAEDAVGQVISHAPRILKQEMSSVARGYMGSESILQSSFRLSPLIAETTGIADIERASLEERVETLALEKVKGVEEKAYKEAYDLGLDEGRDRAFRETSELIRTQLEKFDRICGDLEVLKTRLISHNESHIMRVILELAKRLTFDEIKVKDDRILRVLKEAIETAQSEEDVLVRLNETDLNYLESFKATAGKEWQFLKKIKLEKAPEISPGGCIVTTNYGQVDATIEERVGKLWQLINDKIPRVEDQES